MKAFGARVAPLMSEDVVEICGAQRGRRWRRGFALDLPQPDKGADDAGQGVAVGDGEGGQPKLGGALDHLLGVRGPGEEGEIGGDGELGIGHVPVMFV